MEKDLDLKFKKIRESAKLTSAEKDFHRGEIIKFIETPASPYDFKKCVSPFYGSLTIRKHMLLASLSAILIFGGGITLSARGSLPSDFLYKIKTNVNEPILVFFTPTTKGKAEVKVALVNKRLQEFSQVTLNKNLKTKDKVKFVNRLSSQLKDTQKEILQLAGKKNTSGALHANNSLQSILKTQNIIMDKIQPDERNKDEELESVINTSIDETVEIENQITNAVFISKDETEIDATINSLKKEINLSLESLEKTKQELLKNKNGQGDIVGQDSLGYELADSLADLDRASKKNEEGEKQEALKLYNKIDKDLEKLESLIEAEKEL